MPLVVSGENSIDAWKHAAKALSGANGCEIQDLVVVVENPVSDRDKLGEFDPRTQGGADRVSDVANTLFPLQTWINTKAQGREQFYQRYLRAHARSRHRRWGTYFERLIAFGTQGKNQIEESIGAALTWRNSPRNAICWHLSSPELDGLRPLGSPCLQAIQVHCHLDRVDFSVFYRNHNYFEKALGNFVGLGRLLMFFSEQTQRQVGRLVCYSTHAYSSGGKQRLQLLAQL